MEVVSSVTLNRIKLKDSKVLQEIPAFKMLLQQHRPPQFGAVLPLQIQTSVALYTKTTRLLVPTVIPNLLVLWNNLLLMTHRYHS